LVVDDESETRTALCNYFPLESIGFEIAAQLENGRQALEFLRENKVDVLLCDIKMPVMNGFQLVEKLKEEAIHPVILFLSGQHDFEYTRQAIQLGVVRDYLAKPTRYNEFITVFGKIKDELDETGRNQDKELEYNAKIIQKVKEYVTANYQTVTLGDLAQYVHMNRNYLSQFFAKHCEESFSAYVMQVRMTKAAELLKDIQFRVHEISVLVGYGNPKNFSRSFKKHYGISPREYRDLGGT
jgi:YesN/AraC family two-component response regulator